MIPNNFSTRFYFIVHFESTRDSNLELLFSMVELILISADMPEFFFGNPAATPYIEFYTDDGLKTSKIPNDLVDFLLSRPEVTKVY